MDREGLSKIRRAELLARLDALDSQIEAQARRAKYVSEWAGTPSSPSSD